MKNRFMRNNRGQFILEAILVMVIFMGIVVLVAGYFQKNDVLSSLIKGPWQRLSGMLQNGEWMSPAQSQAYHPSQPSRHVTIEGIKP
jgi:hypothetical protein